MRKQQLITALRSGQYKQTTDELRKGDCFCVLGVACDLYDPNKWNTDGTYKRTHAAMVEFGLNGLLQAELIFMNDIAGKTFSEIADYLEETCTS